MTAWIGLIGAIVALVTAITGLVSAVRGHNVVNNHVKPQAQANTDAIVRLAADASSQAETDVRKIINGAASGS